MTIPHGANGPHDWTPLRADVHAAADRFAAQISAVTDLDQPVPKMDWTVSELAKHVLSLPALYLTMHDSAQPLALPVDIGAHNRALMHDVEIAHFGEALHLSLENLFNAWGTHRSRLVNHWVTAQPIDAMAGLVLNELLMHSHDLGQLTGETVRIETGQALSCLAGLLPASVNFVDPAAARKAAGIYHLRFRGGGDWTQTVLDGSVTVEPGKPERADLHINADPTAFLLVSQGRRSQAWANLTGRIVAYGRKPWKGLALSRIFVET